MSDKQAAPARRLTPDALRRLESLLEAAQVCGDPKCATALELLISWYKEEHA